MMLIFSMLLEILELSHCISEVNVLLILLYKVYMYPIDKVDLVLISVKQVEIRIHRRWF